jgi:predicted O-methyltransferase YrrM
MVKMFWKKNSIKELLPPPVQAEHAEYSMILSACDKQALLTPELLSLSLKAIEQAASVEIESRSEQARQYGNVWPGEHYKLLAGFMLALKPAMTIEIGTSTGLSALSMKQHLPPGGKLVTFDVLAWHEYPNTLFREDDFENQQLVQHVADLSRDEEMEKYASFLEEAELIFIDATHDGALEAKLLKNLDQINFRHKVYVLFDDIKVWTMLKMWREVSFPKIDLTSFGHWSGTGLVELR